MANTSIYAAFEKMWQHVNDKIGTKEEKIYKQNEEPAEAVEGSLWIDMDADGTIDNSGSGSVDLTGYATEQYVDNAIANIEIQKMSQLKQVSLLMIVGLLLLTLKQTQLYQAGQNNLISLVTQLVKLVR